MRKSPGWEWAASYAATTPVWSPEIRAEIRDALAYLRTLLEPDGKTWSGWEAGHHLARQFLSGYGGGLPEGVRLARLLHALGSGAGVEALARRLGGRDWTEYFGAMTELEIAGRIARSGRRVEIIRPHGIGVAPDFVATLDGRPVTFECTALNSRAAEESAERVLDELFEFPRFHGRFRGAVIVRFCRGAFAGDARRRLPEIRAAVHRAGATGRSVRLKGLAVVEPIEGSRAPVVVADGDLLTGTRDDELVHIARALRNKIRRGQLRGRAASVLVLRIRCPFLGEDEHLLRLTTIIVDTVGRMLALPGAEHVSAVLAYQEWRASRASPVAFRGAGYDAVRNQDEDGSNRLVVLVRNPSATAALSKRECSLLIGPRMIW